MTKSEINIAMNEALGWKKETRKMYAGKLNVKGWGLNTHLPLGDCNRHFIFMPDSFTDYSGDLNAMQSAVCAQSVEFQIEFAQRLRAHAERIGCMVHQVNCSDWAVIFVDIKRVKGLWKK